MDGKMDMGPYPFLRILNGDYLAVSIFRYTFAVEIKTIESMLEKEIVDKTFLGTYFYRDDAHRIACGPIDQITWVNETWYLRHRNGSFTFVEDSVMKHIIDYGWGDISNDPSNANIIRPIRDIPVDFDYEENVLSADSLVCDLGEEIEMSIQSITHDRDSDKFKVVVEYDESDYLCNLDFLNPDYQSENNSPKQLLTKTIYFTRNDVTLMSMGYIIYGECPNTAFYSKVFSPRNPHSRKDINPLNMTLDKVKEKYTCVKIPEQMASCPEDVGIVSISNEEGYMGAVQIYKGRMYYVPRGLDGKRWFTPILKLENIEEKAQLLKRVYDKVGVKLEATTDFGDYANNVYYGIENFLVFMSAKETQDTLADYTMFDILNVIKFSIRKTKHSVFIQSNLTDNIGVYVDNILDGIKHVSSILSDFCNKADEMKRKLPQHLRPFCGSNEDTTIENKNTES